jgi:methionine synthase I (cobalamin-dependent)
MRLNFADAIKLAVRPLLLDGAVGTRMLEKIKFEKPELWTTATTVKELETLEETHREYIEAGAEIITTNTFRANPLTFKKYGIKLNYKEIVKLNVQAAKNAKGSYHNIYIAGSNGPAEDCYQKNRTASFKELEANHIEHITTLMECGVDFILNETQSHLDEIKIISKYCSQNNIPYAISFYLNENLKLLSGEFFYEAVEIALKNDAILVSFNCVNFETFFRLKKNYELGFYHGFYLNCGIGDLEEGKIIGCINPVEYANSIVEYFNEKKLKLIGSCCGSNPEHTKELRKKIDELFRT